MCSSSDETEKKEKEKKKKKTIKHYNISIFKRYCLVYYQCAFLTVGKENLVALVLGPFYCSFGLECKILLFFFN